MKGREIKRRFIAGALSALLMFGSTMTVTAEESVDVEEAITEDAADFEEAVTEDATEEVATEDSAADEEVATEEVALDDTEENEEIAPEDTTEAEEIFDENDVVVEEEGYFDISDQLFYNGAISPEYYDVDLDVEPVFDYEITYSDADDCEVVGVSVAVERNFAVYLYNQLVNRPSRVDVSAYRECTTAATSEEAAQKLQNYLMAMLNEHPELFEISGGFRYSPVSSNGIYYVSALTPIYNTDGHNMELLDERIKEALSVVQDEMSDMQKAIAIHDYLVSVSEYDYERYLNGTLAQHPDTYNMYGVLVDNVAVCQGFAETYKYLLNKVGITAYIVSSKNRNHAWNLIEIDEKLYYVDVTWDQSTYDRIGRINHTNLLCGENDSSFVSKHIKGERDWIVYADYRIQDLIATGTKYNSAYWKNVSSALVYHEGYYYYAAASSYSSVSVRKVNANDLTLSGYSTVCTIKDSTTRGSNAFEYNGKLCFNTGSAVYAMDYKTQDTQMIFSTTDQMYRAVLSHGVLIYSLNEPSSSIKQTVAKGTLDGVYATYSLVYNANGGSGTNITTTCECGKSYTASTNMFTRTGYTFTGWNTKADGSGMTYSAGASFKDLAASGKTTTLYAQWKLAYNTVQYVGASCYYDGSITMISTILISEDLYKDFGAYVKFSDGTRMQLLGMSGSMGDDGITLTFSTHFAVKDIQNIVEIKFYTSINQCTVIDNKGIRFSSNTVLLSAADYLNSIIRNGSSYGEKSVAVAESLLAYGEYTYAYFKGTDIAPVTDLSAVTIEKFEKYKSDITGSSNGLEYLGASLTLENDTIIKHYFMLDEGYAIDEFSFICARYGKEYDYYLQATDITNIYYIEVRGFDCYEFDSTYRLRMSKGGDFTIDYGVYSYAYDALEKGTNQRLINVVKAMYLFGSAVEGY
ncbi:MAG: InlB B-repeat-containing protein [Lachnospiraceae bacterium]|nr:InlB B-repeat-containing protein [Lachnospiraceae bacterium]